MATKKEKNEIKERVIEKVIVKTNYTPTIIVGIIALFVIAIISSSYENSDDKKTIDGDIAEYTTAKTVDEYLTMMDDSETHVFYFARPTCSYCVKFAPIMAEVIDEYDLVVYYINTDEEESSAIQAIQDSAIELTDFGTPTIAITKAGEVTAVNSGYVEKETLIDFFEKNNIINETTK